MSLDRELKTYEDKLPELLSDHAGEYVLIKGDRLVDTFVSYEDALRQGYREFGVEPFLVKQVEASETAYLITRKFDPISI